jgi:hypothetical protein
VNPIGPDERLRAALKHAPDADALPPAHVSAQIIAAAHRAVAEAPRAAPPMHAPWWRRPWGASGALASVLLAGFIGLMWRGEAPGPTVEGEAPAPAAAPATVPAAVVAAAAPASVEAAPLVAPKPAAAPLRQAMAVALPVAAESRGAAKASVDAPAEPARPLADAIPPPAPLPAAPAAPPAPVPAPAAAAVAPQRAAARLSAAVATAALPERQDGDQWDWQGDSALRAPDAAWLARLGQLTENRWQSISTAGGAAANTAYAPLPPVSRPGQLLWLRGGRPLGSFRFDSDAVWWCAAQQACQRAAVPAADLKDLLEALERTR